MMILFRPYDPATDYPTLQTWWRGHGALDVPEDFLPDGWIAHEDGAELAASFFYLHAGQSGRIGVIEWTTSNPKAPPRLVLPAIRGLYERLEIAAREAGAKAVISFVDPDSWERRTMAKMGYVTSGDAKPHLLFAKSLRFQHAGGVVACR